MMHNLNGNLKDEQRIPERIWIQRFSGGLGNQIMEYIFFRYVERRLLSVTCVLDDMYYYVYGCKDLPGQFEQIFSVELKRMSLHYDPDIFNEVLRLYRKGVYLPQILLDIGLPIVMISNSTSDWKADPFKGIIVEKPRGYFPEVIDLPYSYIYSVCQYDEKCWFMQDRQENLAELSFPPITEPRNLEYADLIRSHMSVGIHVRRGDFLECGVVFENNAFRRSCELVLEKYLDVWFFVFSDNLDWCKSHSEEMGFNLSKHTVYVSGNEEPDKNYRDMQLLSMCRGIIRIGISTFSGAASWMAQNLAFEVVIGGLYTYDPKICNQVKFFERARK